MLSCVQSDRRVEEIRKLSGREMEFCGQYEVYPKSMSADFRKMLDSSLKIMTYIENPPCTECIASTLVQWKDIINDIDSEIPYIFIVKADKNVAAIKDVFLRAGIVPFAIYSDDNFKNKNSLDVLSVNRTMLLGTDNKILVVGEPFWDNRMMELYKRCISKEKELKCRN